MEAAFASIIAAATPLVFAAVGETITERSGVVNLGLEGSLMLSAMTGFAVAVTTGAPSGFVAAALVSMAVAGLVAFAAMRLGVSQIAVGFVLTLLAIDLSDYLGGPYWCGGTRRARAQHPGAVRDPSARPSSSRRTSWSTPAIYDDRGQRSSSTALGAVWRYAAWANGPKRRSPAGSR